MLDKVAVFTKKKAVAIVAVTGVVLILLVVLRFLFPSGSFADLSTLEGRAEFLRELGWEIDTNSEAYRTVVVPESLNGVLKKYNDMQQAQGYDLNQHLGEKCRQYTYVVTNYPNYSGTVFVTIYVSGRDVVAGDVHTAAADGFMHGLKRP